MHSLGPEAVRGIAPPLEPTHDVWSEGSIVPRGLWIASCSRACPRRQDGCRASGPWEEEEERLYLQLETRERVQTNEAKSKRCRASPIKPQEEERGLINLLLSLFFSAFAREEGGEEEEEEDHQE